MAEKPRMISGEYVTVEIYDQLYHLSGQDPAHIRELAAVVDAKMRAVAAQGRTADSLRVAVLAALNLADEVSQATSADLQLGHVRANTLRMLMDEVLGEKQGSGVREQGTGGTEEYTSTKKSIALISYSCNTQSDSKQFRRVTIGSRRKRG